MLNIVYMEDWPPLAWVAALERGSNHLTVYCGRQVESGEGWFCEAVWDGDFSEANFHLTDVVFGSGARQLGDRSVFVSSGTTVDRLQWFERDGKVYVSNSIVALSSLANLTFDPSCDEFLAVFLSIVNGIEKYERQLPCREGVINLCYFHNLNWDGQHLEEVEKPGG